jgi:uncharacterized protein YbjT (DUF2867 family)
MTGTLVIGSGALGGAVVRALLAHPGAAPDRVRVLSRHPRPVPGADPGRVELIAGSITDAAAVRTALDGIGRAVVCVESAPAEGGPNAPTPVHLGGLRHVMAGAASGTHVVQISQIYVTRPQAFPAGAVVAAVRARAEQELRDSGLPYTIVRPSWLTDGPGGRATVVLAQGDDGEGEVTRADVADVVAATVAAPRAAAGLTFEVYARPGPAVTDWPGAFSRLRGDPR